MHSSRALSLLPHPSVCIYIIPVSNKAPCPWRRSDQVVACVVAGKLKDHQLEKKLGDHARAVVVRRSLFERRIGRSMENLPVQVRFGAVSSLM